MSTPETPSLPAASDSGFLSGLIPNHDRGRFLRAAVLLFLVFSSVGSFLLLDEFWAEFQARHNWPVARGEVVSCEEKSGEGMPRRKTVYWMECEVKFDVPADQCLTGVTAAAIQDPYPCFGIARSPVTAHFGVTNGWKSSISLDAQEDSARSSRAPGQVCGRIRLARIRLTQYPHDVFLDDCFAGVSRDHTVADPCY